MTTLTPFPFDIGPLNNITPFTYRDGTTFVEVLYKIRDYINLTLRPEFDVEMTRIITEFQTGLANSEAHVDSTSATLTTLVNNTITSLTTLVNNARAYVDTETASARAYVDTMSAYVNNKTGDAEIQRHTLVDNSYVVPIDALWPTNHPVNFALKQDATGGHTITQAAGISGRIDLDLAPNAVTEFTIFPNGDGTWHVRNKFVRTGEIVVAVRDYYPSGYVAGTTDLKSAFDAAVAAAPEGATIQFESGKTHFMTSGAPIPKSLIIDGNGSSLNVDPTPGAGTTGTPVFYFAGTLSGTAYTLTSSAKDSATVTTATAGDAANFAPGDHVILSDNTQVRPWDYGGAGAVPTYPEGYYGREEITTIKTVDPATGIIKLLKPIENSYTTTPVITKITKMIQSPVVKNFARIHEIDPGGLNLAFPDFGPNVPHIIHGQYCHTPFVDGIAFDGVNRHCINFHRSINPQITRSTAKNPFRPTDGGHGYFARFDRSLGGHMYGTHSEGMRHHLDHVMNVDAGSSNNVAESPASCAFIGHGLGARRIHSTNDTVHDTGSAWGWCAGNLAFGPDYDFVITNPRYNGQSNAIVMHATAQRMRVVNPNIHSTTRAILMTTGASDLEVSGGEVEVVGTSATGNTLLARTKEGLADPYGLTPGHVRWHNVRMRGVNPSMSIDCNGAVEILDNTFDEVNETAVGSGVNVIQINSVPTALRIAGNRMFGVFSNGVYMNVAAPAGLYGVELNNFKGFTVKAVVIPAAGNLKFLGNGAPGLALPFNITGDLVGAKTGGAIVLANSPSTLDELTSVMSITSQGVVAINGAAGGTRPINFTTGGVLRWIARATAAAESGGNVGTDFEIISRADDGSALATVFNATRLGDVKIGVGGRNMGFYGNTPVARPVVTGSRAGEGATALSLRNAMSALGLITDSTTA